MVTRLVRHSYVIYNCFLLVNFYVFSFIHAKINIQIYYANMKILKVFIFRVTPESIRWLVSQGKLDLAKSTIKRVEKWNNIKVSNQIFAAIVSCKTFMRIYCSSAALF